MIGAARKPAIRKDVGAAVDAADHAGLARKVPRL